MKRRCPSCGQYRHSYSFSSSEALSKCDFCAVKAQERRAAESGSALPCLNRNNCIETGNGQKNKQLPEFHQKFKSEAESKSTQLNEFSTAHKKSAAALEMNVHQFIETFGIDHCGFLTLTFADHVVCVKEASRRFHSMRTNYLRHMFKHYICVYERTKRGRIHFHLIVACKQNIRRGLNFKAIASKDYSSACEELRQLWQSLRNNMPKYGFGRTELLPVKTNSKGLSKYVAKYISKHIDSRLPEDKGYRLIRTTIDKKSLWKIATSNFSFRSEGSKTWREKLKAWALLITPYLKQWAEEVKGYYIDDLNEENYNIILSEILGSKWAYKNREIITALQI